MPKRSHLLASCSCGERSPRTRIWFSVRDTRPRFFLRGIPPNPRARAECWTSTQHTAQTRHSCCSASPKDGLALENTCKVSASPLRPMLDVHCAWGPLRNGAQRLAGLGHGGAFWTSAARGISASLSAKPWCCLGLPRGGRERTCQNQREERPLCTYCHAFWKSGCAFFSPASISPPAPRAERQNQCKKFT